jgi:Uma2 family endonuclease
LGVGHVCVVSCGATGTALLVISHHDEFGEITEKMEEYLAAGVPLVWVIDPENEIAYVHRKDGSVTKFKRDDELSGEDVLNGFRCKLADLFPS